MDWEKLETKIGVSFNNENLLTQAFVHRSYLNENPNFGLNHNERLEFLGDAVLELAITDYLYKKYDNPEGELTAWRASLVNTRMLSSIAMKDLGLSDYLLLSKGEAKDIGKARQVILANTLEALIGAIYLDQGYDSSAEFIGRFIILKLPEIIKHRAYKDSKSNFQEIAQEKKGVTPRYAVLEEWGLDHAKNFKIGVFLGEEKVGEGEGVSKQDAQQQAAEDALKKLGWG